MELYYYHDIPLYWKKCLGKKLTKDFELKVHESSEEDIDVEIPPEKRLLEVCVDNIRSAEIAINAGADRLELCSHLNCGGLTPSYGLYKTVKKISKEVPVNVLIRPRAGDFNYNDQEICVMEEDIKYFVSLNVDGLVFGVLKKNKNEVETINKRACLRLLNLCKGIPATFHRAFDLCVMPVKSLNTVIELGFNRILTSGFSETAYIGRYNIAALIQRARGKIIIMPGCGITKTNLKEILEVTGASEFHASASKAVSLKSSVKNEIVKGTLDYSLTSFLIVQRMKEILEEIEF